MNAATLTPIVWVLTGLAWVSFVVFVWAAFAGPRIASLTERTWIALLIALLGTVASLLRYNTDTGFSLFSQATATLLFAITILLVLAVPAAWLVLFVTGRLGRDV